MTTETKPKLWITRGYPASGKTTWAKMMCAAPGNENIKRISRDDIRFGVMGFPLTKGVGTYHEEERVTRIQHTIVNELLASGYSVIVDDTNLRAKSARALVDVAVQVGADWEVVDILTPADECVRRDANRRSAGHRFVGDEVIRNMERRYPIKLWSVIRPTTSEAPAKVYVPDESKPTAFIFDIDGTLARMEGRSPYDWSRVFEDSLHEWVAVISRALAEFGCFIICVSGRDAVCYDDTFSWLDEMEIPFDELHMRGKSDTRRDDIVKTEIFFNEIASRYHVLGAFDDRNQVVDMWRRIGVPCAQVALGDF